MGKKGIIGQLKNFKKKIESHHKIDKLILFGSRASGKATMGSDVDLLIVSKEFRGKDAFDRPYHFYLDWDLDYSVDFLCYTPSEYKRLSRQITIAREVARTGIEI
ncbi:nucleotidyltransferase domain-containing protein [Candidatus Woesearchaeota archaeon]|nr:nucleotidyltransferase domain-containing protein [Candidatus Woesearchaeota archaeon]